MMTVKCHLGRGLRVSSDSPIYLMVILFFFSIAKWLELSRGGYRKPYLSWWHLDRIRSWVHCQVTGVDVFYFPLQSDWSCHHRVGLATVDQVITICECLQISVSTASCPISGSQWSSVSQFPIEKWLELFLTSNIFDNFEIREISNRDIISDSRFPELEKSRKNLESKISPVTFQWTLDSLKPRQLPDIGGELFVIDICHYFGFDITSSWQSQALLDMTTPVTFQWTINVHNSSHLSMDSGSDPVNILSTKVGLADATTWQLQSLSNGEKK